MFRCKSVVDFEESSRQLQIECFNIFRKVVYVSGGNRMMMQKIPNTVTLLYFKNQLVIDVCSIQ